MTSPLLVVCMGVSGSGKTTLAQELAKRLQIEFVEADDLHTQSNRETMARGIGLSDAQRDAWMDKVCAALAERAERGTACVIAHSALHRRNRERLRATGFQCIFLYLRITQAAITERLSKRRDHFASASLLPSQFRALETPCDEPDVLTLQADQPVEALGDTAHRQIVGITQFVSSP